MTNTMHLWFPFYLKTLLVMLVSRSSANTIQGFKNGDLNDCLHFQFVSHTTGGVICYLFEIGTFFSLSCVILEN